MDCSEQVNTQYVQYTINLKKLDAIICVLESLQEILFANFFHILLMSLLAVQAEMSMAKI